MGIDPTIMYEIHRPKELGSPEGDAKVRSMVSDEQWEQFLESRRRAGTAGPIMIGGAPGLNPGEAVVDIYRIAQEGHARPCRIDEETGQVFIGHFVYVPKVSEDSTPEKS